MLHSKGNELYHSHPFGERFISLRGLLLVSEYRLAEEYMLPDTVLRFIVDLSQRGNRYYIPKEKPNPTIGPPGDIIFITFSELELIGVPEV
jgi:hypothetical protein